MYNTHRNFDAQNARSVGRSTGHTINCGQMRTRASRPKAWTKGESVRMGRTIQRRTENEIAFFAVCSLPVCFYSNPFHDRHSPNHAVAIHKFRTIPHQPAVFRGQSEMPMHVQRINPTGGGWRKIRPPMRRETERESRKLSALETRKSEMHFCYVLHRDPSSNRYHDPALFHSRILVLVFRDAFIARTRAFGGCNVPLTLSSPSASFSSHTQTHTQHNPSLLADHRVELIQHEMMNLFRDAHCR